MTTALSVLDPTIVPSGLTAADTVAASVGLARHAEVLGYRRLWVTEHHNHPGLAMGTPPALMAHLAARRTGCAPVPVGTCCPTTPRRRWPNGSPCSPPSTPAGSTSAWGADRAPVRPPPARSAAPTRTTSRRWWRSYRRSSGSGSGRRGTRTAPSARCPDRSRPAPVDRRLEHVRRAPGRRRGSSLRLRPPLRRRRRGARPPAVPRHLPPLGGAGPASYPHHRHRGRRRHRRGGPPPRRSAPRPSSATRSRSGRSRAG